MDVSLIIKGKAKADIGGYKLSYNKKDFEGVKYVNNHWGSEEALDDFCRRAFETNESNFWVTSAVDTSEDKVSFTKMNEAEQDIFIKSSIILQQIDKNQSTHGMVGLAQKTPNPSEEMVYMFQAGMEAVHSKSYNRINSSLVTSQKEKEYVEWAENNPYVQRVINFLFSKVEESAKIEGIPGYLRSIAYSNTIEGYLFFSLFYQFLRTARVENLMVKSLEIILLIMRDESVHHGFAGVIFNEYYNILKKEEDEQGIPVEDRETTKITNELIEDFTFIHELVGDMIDHLYEPFGEAYKEEVVKYTNYNFNRLLRSLGFKNVFSEEDSAVRHVILADLNKVDTNADNFSMVGDTYYMMDYKPFVKSNNETVDIRLESGGDLVPNLR